MKRIILKSLVSRLLETRAHIQILLGPRQVGKTTCLNQLKDELPNFLVHYCSADEQNLVDRLWIEREWQKARDLKSTQTLLVLDEIQKINQWSETVKKLWDEDTKDKRSLKVVLSGSASLAIQKGLSESLAGRFETILAPHWSYSEIKELYPDINLKDYIFWGGYPGAYQLKNDYTRWRKYLIDSIVENVLTKDIFQKIRVDKPVLMRNLFELSCLYGGQLLSYQKMLGQLQDVGNTTTLAHYLELLEGAYLVVGLEKFSSKPVQRKGSSPKLLPLNTALMTALANVPQADLGPDEWGRYFEVSVGAQLYQLSIEKGWSLTYWKKGNFEVDYVLKRGKQLTAIEVKSGRRTGALSGLKEFKKEFPSANVLLLDHSDGTLAKFLLDFQI